MWVQSLGQEEPLEKGMAIHSSLLAWKTPWTEEPEELQSGRATVGCHFLLQGFFLTQGLNLHLLCLLPWQVDPLPLSHLGSPIFR